MDPFEEEDSLNLATLSGRDPFNKEFVEKLSGIEKVSKPEIQSEKEEVGVINSYFTFLHFNFNFHRLA